jgi:dipeptidyl aminopeptidase/acylaminoacyl peptidase
MKKIILSLLVFGLVGGLMAQDKMTPELLWQLGRVTAKGITPDGEQVVYSVTHFDVDQNTPSNKMYMIPIAGGEALELANADVFYAQHHVSPDGQYELSVADVKIKKMSGSDFYPDLSQSEVRIYEDLNYRHFDTWEDGSYSHLFLHSLENGVTSKGVDLMPGEPYDCPQKPFGGSEDYSWSPDSKTVVYVAKKKYGKDYATSTNTDLYAYDIATKVTTNLTEGRPGYDKSPAFSPGGELTWLSMARDGYEADKNDIIVRSGSYDMNLTRNWDGTVRSYRWGVDGKDIYFLAATDGTIQLFKVDYPGMTKKMPVVEQITEGDFDITQIVGQSGSTLVVSRTDMNHATELYTVDLTSGTMTQLTHVNDDIYNSIDLSKIERRYVKTTDNKDMLVWVIYPPNFDKNRKYPTLLYLQGGPQSPLSQFYSFRWNFQLMAANDYIIVAPSRRGMPGFGVEWNEDISKDYGGQPMRDYLSAIDELAKEPFIDEDRLGAIGASFGGYSVFYMAGIHEKRFKTFISHAGLFNLKSMYGTTEELFFVDWDFGGNYWDKSNAAAQRTYNEFDPSNLVDKWDTPIMIILGERITGYPLVRAWKPFRQPS